MAHGVCVCLITDQCNEYRFLDGTVRNDEDQIASSEAEASTTHSDTTFHLVSNVYCVQILT